MSNNNGLPKTWTTTTVEQVAKSIQYGHTASATDNSEGPRFLRITDIQHNHVDWNDVPSCDIPSDEIDKYRLQAGDIVFARTGATTGKSYLIRECPDAVFASYLIRLRMRDGVFPPFIQAYFQTNNYWRQIEGGKRGIGQPNVNATVLGTISLPIAPPNEQRRIVAKIEELFSDLDAGVAALERARANMKRYRASVLKAAVEGELTAEWRAAHTPSPGSAGEGGRRPGEGYEPASKLLERILTERRKKWEADQLAKYAAQGKQPPKGWKDKYVEPKGPDTSALPELPTGWCWATVDMLCGFVTSGSRGWAEYYSELGAKFLRVGNLDHDSISLDLRDIQHVIPPDNAESLRTKTVRGDLLISVTADVGMVAVVPEDLGDAFINQHIALCRPVTCESTNYVAWCLTSSVGQAQFRLSQRGATKPGLGLDDVKAAIVPFGPLSEQQEIVAEIAEKFSQIEAAELAIDHGLQRAARLRQSILKRAFEGKLEPQDPNDEPAEKMLEGVKGMQTPSKSIGTPHSPVQSRGKSTRKSRIR